MRQQQARLLAGRFLAPDTLSTRHPDLEPATDTPQAWTPFVHVRERGVCSVCALSCVPSRSGQGEGFFASEVGADSARTDITDNRAGLDDGGLRGSGSGARMTVSAGHTVSVARNEGRDGGGVALVRVWSGWPRWLPCRICAPSTAQRRQHLRVPLRPRMLPPGLHPSKPCPCRPFSRSGHSLAFGASLALLGLRSACWLVSRTCRR